MISVLLKLLAVPPARVASVLKDIWTASIKRCAPRNVTSASKLGSKGCAEGADRWASLMFKRWTAPSTRCIFWPEDALPPLAAEPTARKKSGQLSPVQRAPIEPAPVAPHALATANQATASDQRLRLFDLGFRDRVSPANLPQDTPPIMADTKIQYVRNRNYQKKKRYSNYPSRDLLNKPRSELTYALSISAALRLLVSRLLRRALRIERD